jgi:acetyl esterase/lipase
MTTSSTTMSAMTTSTTSAIHATARPPFDPELEGLLGNGPLPTVVTADMIDELRANPFTGPIEEMLAARGFAHETVPVPGPGDPLNASVLTPPGKSATGPGIYFILGGGFMIGDRLAGIATVVDHAAEHGAVIVSVDYRLAPEHPDPAPLDDAYAGFVWTAGHAAELGIDPDRILLAGNSAGAGLAAGVALLARDRQGPKALAQMLLAPMLDDRDDTPSALQYEGIGAWSRESNTTGWTALLGDRRGTDAVSPYTAPARAARAAWVRRTLAG